MPAFTNFPRFAAVLALLAAFAPPVAAQKGKAAPAGTPADQALAAYLARVRQVEEKTTLTTGSIWTPNGRFADLSTDYKARNVNDLITINIIENTQATGAGSVQSKRTFTASSGVSTIFGKSPAALATLFAPTSTADLEAQGASNSSQQLTTSLTGRVVDLLPNGFLVIEAVRTILMNNEQQTVTVRGVIRPGDIAPDNSVLSTQVGDLEVELQGKGVISNATRPLSGWLGLLLKFLSF
jgi:flagellar L-ring protein precursor FlgH